MGVEYDIDRSSRRRRKNIARDVEVCFRSLRANTYVRTSGVDITNTCVTSASIASREISSGNAVCHETKIAIAVRTTTSVTKFRGFVSSISNKNIRVCCGGGVVYFKCSGWRCGTYRNIPARSNSKERRCRTVENIETISSSSACVCAKIVQTISTSAVTCGAGRVKHDVLRRCRRRSKDVARDVEFLVWCNITNADVCACRVYKECARPYFEVTRNGGR